MKQKYKNLYYPISFGGIYRNYSSIKLIPDRYDKGKQ